MHTMFANFINEGGNIKSIKILCRVNMQNKDTKYFIAANTSKGYRSYLRQAEKQMDIFKTMLLPQNLVSEIIEKSRLKAFEDNYSVETILNPLTNREAGILIPEREVGFINLSIFERSEYDKQIQFSGKKIEDTMQNINQAYGFFAKALKVHDEWEKVYISNMDFEAADKLRNQTIKKLLPSKSTNNQGIRKDRFLGASTYKGPVDYIEDITKDLNKRYFIKGRPGTGKSTFMKGIAEEAFKRGFSIDIYHCSFDPDSLDMIVINELNLAIFDSTAPHEHSPSISSDEIIDIYDIAVNKFTDEKYKEQLSLIEAEYRSNISKALNELKKAKETLYDSEILISNIELSEKKSIYDKIWSVLFD